MSRGSSLPERRQTVITDSVTAHPASNTGRQPCPLTTT